MNQQNLRPVPSPFGLVLLHCIWPDSHRHFLSPVCGSGHFDTCAPFPPPMAPSSGVSNEGRSSNRPPADNNRRPMKRKFGQPTLPNLYYKHADGILSVPGYTFDKVRVCLGAPNISLTIHASGATMARYWQYDLPGRRKQP